MSLCASSVVHGKDKSFPKSGSFSSEPVSPVRESYVEINGSGSATILEECVGSLSDAAFTHRIPSTGNIYDQIIRESGSYDLVMIPLNKSQSKDQSVHIKDLYRVLQKCKCPVLVIPIMPIGKQSPSDPPTPKVILFAVADHSARDACALHCATYAKQFGAKIIIANFLYIKPTVMDPDLRYEKQIEKAYALLETTKMEMIARGVSSDAIFLTLVRTNDTIVDALSETIADTSKLGVRMLGASVYRIDFVVIGSNGGGGISKVLGGESFGEKLFANSFVPMLICTAGTIPK